MIRYWLSEDLLPNCELNFQVLLCSFEEIHRDGVGLDSNRPGTCFAFHYPGVVSTTPSLTRIFVSMAYFSWRCQAS